MLIASLLVLLPRQLVVATAGDLSKMEEAAGQSGRSLRNCPVSGALKYDYAGKPYWKKVRVCT
jgi:hypothetical protein